MFNRLSIRYKLAILLGLSATIGLLISLIIILYATLQEEKTASLQNLHQITNIISENMEAAVAFHDSESADKILLSLRPNTHKINYQGQDIGAISVISDNQAM